MRNVENWHQVLYSHRDSTLISMAVNLEVHIFPSCTHRKYYTNFKSWVIIILRSLAETTDASILCSSWSIRHNKQIFTFASLINTPDRDSVISVSLHKWQEYLRGNKNRFQNNAALVFKYFRFLSVCGVRSVGCFSYWRLWVLTFLTDIFLKLSNVCSNIFPVLMLWFV